MCPPQQLLQLALLMGCAPSRSSAHMPVQVSVRLLSGDTRNCLLPGSATVRDLKAILSQRAGVKPSRLRLVTPAGQQCEEEAGLLALVDCPLADLLDPKALKSIQLELTLHAVICSDACSVCEAGSARRCAGCRLMRYCSRACQLRDWRRHREHCKA